MRYENRINTRLCPSCGTRRARDWFVKSGLVCKRCLWSGVEQLPTPEERERERAAREFAESRELSRIARNRSGVPVPALVDGRRVESMKSAAEEVGCTGYALSALRSASPSGGVIGRRVVVFLDVMAEPPAYLAWCAEAGRVPSPAEVMEACGSDAEEVQLSMCLAMEQGVI